jgi:prophage regulatory protein
MATYRIMRIKEVMNFTGMPQSTIYEKVARRQFPQPVKLGPRSIGWLEDELIEWKRNIIDARDGSEAA